MISGKLWKALIFLNFFMAIFIYLPIFIPLDLYLEVHNLILGIAVVNLMLLFFIDEMREVEVEEKDVNQEEDKGKVVSFFRG